MPSSVEVCSTLRNATVLWLAAYMVVSTRSDRQQGLHSCFGRAQRDSSRWNDAEIYTAVARTLNLTSDQRKTVLAARHYLQDKLAKCVSGEALTRGSVVFCP